MNRKSVLHHAAGLVLLAATSLPMASPLKPSELNCRFHAEAGADGQVTLKFTLRNTGNRELHLLRWGSPFEGGWLGPFVQASTPQGELPFQGAMRKRADPSAQDYLLLKPRETLKAELRLADAYAWPPAAGGSAGPLKLKASWRWHDVMADGKPPRPRSRHEGMDQHCGEITLER